MKHTYDNEPWKKLLPSISGWLDSVKLNSGPEVVAGAHHVVCAVEDSENSENFTLNAPGLQADQIANIISAAQVVGYNGQSGGQPVVVDGATYIIVPASRIGAHRRQLARQFGLDLAKVIKDLKIDHLAICKTDKFDPLDVFDGLANGLYSCDGFKNKPASTDKLPRQVTFAGANNTQASITEKLEFVRANIFTRFLQDAPANYINPPRLAEIAQDFAKENNVACKILDRKAMSELGMGSMLSVGDGGPIEQKTIIIEIEGEQKDKTVALVGKGLTFDSGGISIKPGAGMDEMKYDMSGGAAVLGTAMFLSKVKPPVNVICLVGASENMPSGTATKPGDVVRAMNGKSIEVLNTDAEGRLVLADVLSYAVSNYKPDMMIDIATLTGAVLHGLGSAGSALMSNDQDTAGYILKAAEAEGEPFWQLPMWPEIEVKGDVGDLRNIAKPNVRAGSIVGGVFLKEFVGDTKWAHLDIAGTGWNCQATGYPRTGGCGFGLRTLVSACQRFSK